MKFSITYCSVWNYEPKAASLAAKLKSAFKNSEVELIAGSGGVFDVVAENTLIYSKANTGKFPDEESLIEEILSLK